ncbi:type II toxin-antitoxin system HicA family toxin [Propionivibrio sp.]|uniref:type II toxin-antitoxin system HicA family toxin n=1 Tax=Propionivibrio sp. TaxID=2212460 RepID=UPI003BF34DA7
MNSNEFKRWLTKQGVTYGQAKGSHIKIYLGDKQTILPMHNTDLKTGTVEGIKKQLGLKGK